MSVKPRKIGILGAGNVGPHVALLLAFRGLADEIVLYDVKDKKSAAEAMDIRDAVSYMPHRVSVYASSMADMKDADILINAAGKRAYPWQTRPDLLKDSIKTCQELIPEIKASGFEGIFLSISNPCDVIAYYLQYMLDWPKHKILGSGTALDTARLQMQLAQRLHVSHKSLQSYILGEHGDTNVIPWSCLSAGGFSIDNLLSQREGDLEGCHEKILHDVRQGGYIENADKGCTEFGVASAVCELVSAILHNEHKILPCSVYLNGAYGAKDIFASVPVRLGSSGIEDIIELPLSSSEQALFAQSINALKGYFKTALSIL